MSHRLGSVLSVTPNQVIGPDAGPPTNPPDTWVFTFPVDPLAKFVMLHLNGAALGAGDFVEIELGYDTDRYEAAWGPDFWSRPIRGNLPVTVRYIRVGGGTGSVTLDQYGRGEALVDGGLTNANGDVFLLQTPFANPTYQFYAGKYPAGSDATWENADCLPPGVMRDTARSVGMYIDVDEGKLSSCTATLISADLIVTAGHCVSTDAQVKTGSITFDFQTDCFNNAPLGYNPKFHKLKRLIRTGWTRAPGDPRPTVDYSVLQIVTPPGGLGLPPVPFRPDLPPVAEPLFIIHHPRGATKKISRYPIDSTCQVGTGSNSTKVLFGCDIDNGSSGSSIFDSAGRIVANLSDWDGGISTLAISNDLITEPFPAKDVDVVVVFDRSGSMSLTGLSGSDKITEAQQAAALFISLLRTGASHRVGLVSFSTTASLDFGLAAANAATKNTLIGPVPPGTGGTVGGLAAGGSTTIGGGLQSALTMFPSPGPATNTRAILLMTDGLENTPPMVADVEPALPGARLNVIGFGTDASLDGPGLTRLARDHEGIYTRAGEGLALKKFFALAFGRIFDFGASLDPEFFLPADVMSAPDIPVQVCGETTLTAVLGWENTGATLRLSLVSPGGTTITASSPGVTAGSGSTWAHLRLPLPFGGERDGTWRVRVTRPGFSGEFPPPLPATRFFVTTLADGGPYLRPLPQPPLYTGDAVNPRVLLREPGGGRVHGATVTIEMEAPQDGTGNLLTKQKLGPAGSLAGDALEARANTLIQLEQAKGAPLIATGKSTVPLFDDGDHGDGAMEPDGIFGNPLADLARFEGNYTFHARAVYGEGCVASREATWSVYISVGIDSGQTGVKTEVVATLPDGRERVRVTLTPRDRYGNHLGPGRGGSFTVGPLPGSEPVGGLTDNGDGSYTTEVVSDPHSDSPPGITVTQPGRPPSVVAGPRRRLFRYPVKFVCGIQPECPCECAPVRPGVYATDINIHNFHDQEARAAKLLIPVVTAGAASGREPRVAERQAVETIVLPPHSATMDDCCRIAQLLFGGTPPWPFPLTIGFLEIVSTRELSVTAVYTASDLKTGSVSMDVEQIRSIQD